MVEMSESSRWEKELAQFQKVLANPTGQAIVIVGPEGSGKSTLLTMMVNLAINIEEFRCDGRIHRVGTRDRYIDVLGAIGKGTGGSLTYLNTKSILERLWSSVQEFGDIHRRVVGVDAKPKQPMDLKKWWLEIIPQLPDRVKFIFTQRPDGILATNKQFMALPNVVRIDLETPPASDERQKVFDTDEELRKKVNEKGLVTEGLQGAVQEQVDVEGIATVEVLDKIKIAGMSVAEHGWGDRIADKDKLGFRPYVEVVARFLTHEETELPLTLSVEGEWGSGKSSFLLQLKNEIGRIYKDKGEEKAFIVEFDPWRHDKDEALWAAFALKFIGDASKCLTKRKPWRANYELWEQRFSWKQAWPDVLRFVLIGSAWVLATIGIFIGLWNGIRLGVAGTVILPKWIGSIVALIVSLWAVFGKVKNFLGNPLAMDLKKYMRRPDYVSKVSFIEKFHDDFKKIVNAYAGEGRVYVFIDDLDRCEVPKAAELMESINLMISENPKLVFVMGMDREKVAAGLAVKHEKLLPYLAEPTEKKDLDKDEAKRRRGVRYGYSFIEKFIQVPFRLPQPDEESIEKMLLEMSGQLKEEKKPTGESIGETSETKKADVPQTQIETDKELEEKEHTIRHEKIEEEFLKFDGDDPNFRAIVLMVSKAFDYNPRRAKQFVNIFRLRAATAKVTGLYELKGGKRLTFEQLGKFVGIGLGWPLLVRDIERRPALLEELVGEAEERTEGEAKEKKNQKKNGLRFEKWADDEKLMELLKAGCENEKDAEKYRRFSLKGLDVKKLLQVAPRVMSVEEEMV